MKRLLPLAFLLALMLTWPAGTRAQDSSPIAGGCTADPVPQARIDELAALAATPSAAVNDPLATIDLSQGQPAGDDLRAALNHVVRQAQMCAYLQDLPRLLSFYTDRFIIEQFFSDEPVAIVRTDTGSTIEGTPAPMLPDQEQFVMNAVVLPDGRIAAVVSGNAWGGNPQLYLFVQQDGRWLIDAIGPVPSDFAIGGTGAVTIPPDAGAVVQLVFDDAATRLGVDPSTLSIDSIEAVDWPDTALGCPEDGGVYAQVISPGYRITVTSATGSLEYHTGPNDVFVTCGG